MNEENIMYYINRMCEESLPPDLFEKWENIKTELRLNRKKLVASSSSKPIETKDLIKYIYQFAWIYGRCYHVVYADRILEQVKQKIQLPEEFLNGKEVDYSETDIKKHNPDYIPPVNDEDDIYDAIMKYRKDHPVPPVSGKEVEEVAKIKELEIRNIVDAITVGLVHPTVAKSQLIALLSTTIKETVTDGVDEDKDNFAISFAVWVLHDQQAKSYLNSGCSAYQLLEKYKDRPYIDNDSSKQ